MRVNSAETPSTAKRETSSVINGCSNDDGWGIETVRKLGCEPDGRPGATLAGEEASGMPVSQPFTIGTWTIRFFFAPADDDDVLGVGATIRGGGVDEFCGSWQLSNRASISFRVFGRLHVSRILVNSSSPLERVERSVGIDVDI
jgi:hypothetical protein